MKLSDLIIQALKAHAVTSPNSEVCGFVYRDRYVPLLNISGDSCSFHADPRQLAQVLAAYGEPEGIFHTHPGGNLQPSARDRSQFYYPGSTMIVGGDFHGEFCLNLVQCPVYGHGGD